MTKETWYGVYPNDCDGKPVAVFVDGEMAQAYRKANYGDNAVVLETNGLDAHEEAADLFAMMEKPPEQTYNLGREVLKNEVRAKLERERAEKEVTEEVKREMAARDRAERAESEDDTRSEARQEPSRAQSTSQHATTTAKS